MEYKFMIVSNLYPSKDFPTYGVFVKNFCDQLDELKVKYHLIYYKKRKNKLLKLMSYIKFYLEIVIKLLCYKYEIVYIHYPSHSCLPILLVSKIKKIKIYTNVHGSDVVPQTTTQNKMLKYTKKIIKKSARIIVPSLYFKKLIEQEYGVNSNKIFIYPSGGVNRDVFYPQDIECIPEKIYLGYIGRLAKGKGWDLYLKMLYQITQQEKYSNVKGIVCGNGEESVRFWNMVKKLGLNDKIEYYEGLEQKKLNELYNSMYCFCFPTMRKGESLGLVALEALACGIPVISSNYAAPKYYINELNGDKFEAGNLNDFIQCVEKMLDLNSKEYVLKRQGAFLSSQEFDSKKLLYVLAEILK